MPIAMPKVEFELFPIDTESSPAFEFNPIAVEFSPKAAALFPIAILLAAALDAFPAAKEVPSLHAVKTPSTSAGIKSVTKELLTASIGSLAVPVISIPPFVAADTLATPVVGAAIQSIVVPSGELSICPFVAAPAASCVMPIDPALTL
jgi:hypothetical protein